MKRTTKRRGRKTAKTAPKKTKRPKPDADPEAPSIVISPELADESVEHLARLQTARREWFRRHYVPAVTTTQRLLRRMRRQLELAEALLPSFLRGDRRLATVMADLANYAAFVVGSQGLTRTFGVYSERHAAANPRAVLRCVVGAETRPQRVTLLTTDPQWRNQYHWVDAVEVFCVRTDLAQVGDRAAKYAATPP